MTEPPAPSAEHLQQPSTSEVAADLETASAPRRSRFGVFLKWMLIAFLVMQLIMRTVWEPVWGDALKNLITYSQIMLSGICILIWWFCCARVSASLRFGVGLPVILVLLGWIGSIASIDVDGEMVMTIRYRWQKSNSERLKEFRATAEAASLEGVEATFEPQPGDMPAYRGLRRDGVIEGPPISTDWDWQPPRELWRQPSGGGYSSFAIVAPLAITIEQREDDEAVVCYDLDSGKEYWEHRYRAYFNAMGGPGPRSTPTIHDGAVYTFGCYGDLFCLDLVTGAPRWHVNALQQFGLPNTNWGMTSSPLIVDGKVIVNVGGLKTSSLDGDGLIAYALDTGELLWTSSGAPEPRKDLQTFQTGQLAIEGVSGLTLPGYSSPMLASLAGEEIILNFDGTGLKGHSVQDGLNLFFYPFIAGEYVNVAQPLLFPDDRVFISSGYGKGSMLLQITREGEHWETRGLWPSPSTRMRCKFTSPVQHGGYVYGLDEGRMACLDPKDGSRKWSGGRDALRGRYGHGQMLLVNEHILVLAESGELILIEPSPEELKVKGMIRALPASAKTWNPLAIAQGKVLVRNAEEVACFDLHLQTDSQSTAIAAESAAE